MHREVIMSAPIHMVHSPFRRDKDVGPVHLVYAPRGAREQTQQVSTLPPAPQIELLARGFSGDRGMLERQHALMGRIVLLLLIWSVAGVAVAAGVWAKTWMPDARAPLSVSLGNDDRWLAPVATRPEQPNQQVDVAARGMPEPKTTQEPANSPDRSESTSFNSPAATMTQPPPAQGPVPAAAAATRELPPQQTVLDFVTRHLDADELALMLRRADDLIKSGDFSSARLLLTRVAEAGDARAALTLAGTFDPDVLRAAGMQSGAPDIALARLWYERAAQLGAADAPRRLRELATASAR
jgi:hypothetical protein